MTFVQILELIEEIVKLIEQVQWLIGRVRKMLSVLNTNLSLNCLKLIRVIHYEINGILLQTLDIAIMQFVPITSVEVERFFSW